MQVKVIALLNSLTITLAYFFTGLSSSFLFWLGLLFGYPLYPVRVALVSASLTLVLVAWVAHRKFGGQHSMAYSTTAFVGGGIIGSIGVWLLYFWLLIIVSIVSSEYP